MATRESGRRGQESRRSNGVAWRVSQTSVVVEAVDPPRRSPSSIPCEKGDSAVQKLSSKSPEESFDLAAPLWSQAGVCGTR
ncbi:MAG: hypothetical protein IPN71_21685 [Fibrobacteres bacterium]|nr:hypothetical protein [Fibrobacterota bacterium]